MSKILYIWRVFALIFDAKPWVYNYLHILQYDGGRNRRTSRSDDYHAKMQRAGSETLLKTDLEQSKEAIKSEIRKQLKLKEGAENLKKVATDKKTIAQCNSILKEATAKLQDLHDDLQDLNARVSEDTPCKYINCSFRWQIQ